MKKARRWEENEEDGEKTGGEEEDGKKIMKKVRKLGANEEDDEKIRRKMDEKMGRE